MRFGFWLAAFILTVVPGFANGIQYVCDSTDSNQIGTSVCNTLTSTVEAQYASIFTNANALIYVQYGNIGGDVGQNVQFYNTVSYSSYYNALTANEQGSNDVTAVGSLGGSTTNPVVAGDGVALTSSLDAALGLSGATGICTTATNASCVAKTPSCALGTANCYNDIITISNSASLYYDTGAYTNGQYDFFTAVEHETDEALGTSSCIENAALALAKGCANGGDGVSAADLFRYSAPGSRSFLGTDGAQANGTPAYFSINGGGVEIATYNNSPNGADYGDWSTTCKYVQDADACSSQSGLTIANDGGVEIAVLDAVGYNLTPLGESLTVAVPEPGNMAMFAGGLVLLAGLVRLQRRAVRAVRESENAAS
jgi:hypothetical protein